MRESELLFEPPAGVRRPDEATPPNNSSNSSTVGGTVNRAGAAKNTSDIVVKSPSTDAVVLQCLSGLSFYSARGDEGYDRLYISDILTGRTVTIMDVPAGEWPVSCE
ncbi:MAG: hypothetical protein QOF19_3394 [Alphaproteobacteria bacterium]|jgi:hypothetical protein|nr:hypothetical protein [Alphaproteobacteria bacterium]